MLFSCAALQQQHLAASIVSQQAMLQHKKFADNLITQQKIAKQQQIAAIVKEQKVQANMAAQQRIAQHQKIAEQQKQQAILQSAKQHIAQQQVVRCLPCCISTIVCIGLLMHNISKHFIWWSFNLYETS